MTFFEPLPPWPFDQPFQTGYQLLVVDPPWTFEHRSSKGWGKSAEGKYETQAIDWIAALPIFDMAGADCLLLMWMTNPLADQAIGIPARWGFTFKTKLTWRKVSKNGKALRATGFRAWGMSEDVVMATRGNPKHKALEGCFDGLRREHSRKPEEFYRMVEARCPNLRRRADVFARTQRPGWDAYGNELEKFQESV
jgi:N6-adenosine-specific RNA methylase IME4